MRSKERGFSGRVEGRGRSARRGVVEGDGGDGSAGGGVEGLVEGEGVLRGVDDGVGEGLGAEERGGLERLGVVGRWRGIRNHLDVGHLGGIVWEG